MQTLDIHGANYAGYTAHTRAAARGIVMEGGRILLMHAEKPDVWMLPGGGLEHGETYEACCIRELGEESGLIVEPIDAVILLREFYEDWRYDSCILTCRVTGSRPRSLTEGEREAALMPKWLPLSEALAIFTAHADMHPASDEEEMRRGIYQREYLALTEAVQHALIDLRATDLLSLAPARLTDLGVCPTCLNRHLGGALYGDMTDKLVYADDDVECFFVANPRAPGHMCIASVEHYHDMSEAPDELNAKVIRFAKRLMQIIRGVYGCERVYLCTMCDGPMNHYHVQLIPRYPNEQRGSRNFVKQRSAYVYDGDKFHAVKARLDDSLQR